MGYESKFYRLRDRAQKWKMCYHSYGYENETDLRFYIASIVFFDEDSFQDLSPSAGADSVGPDLLINFYNVEFGSLEIQKMNSCSAFSFFEKRWKWGLFDPRSFKETG